MIDIIRFTEDGKTWVKMSEEGFRELITEAVTTAVAATSTSANPKQQEIETFFWNGRKCKIHDRECCLDCMKAQAYAQAFANQFSQRVQAFKEHWNI